MITRLYLNRHALKLSFLEGCKTWGGEATLGRVTPVAGSRNEWSSTNPPSDKAVFVIMFIRRDIEWDFIDALAAVKLAIAVYQTFEERWRDVPRSGVEPTIRVGAGLTEMKRLGVAALQLMLTFGK